MTAFFTGGTACPACIFATLFVSVAALAEVCAVVAAADVALTGTCAVEATAEAALVEACAVGAAADIALTGTCAVEAVAGAAVVGACVFGAAVKAVLTGFVPFFWALGGLLYAESPPCLFCIRPGAAVLFTFEF